MKKIVPYIFAVSSLAALPSCEKEQPIEQRPVSYKFNLDNIDAIFQYVDDAPTFKDIKASIADPKVSEVRLITEGSWETLGAGNISRMINIALRPATELSPRVNGGGSNWEFTPGAATKADSIWLTQHNWTVNKHLVR